VVHFLLQPLTLFFPEDEVGLVPKRGCLLTLAYYAFPRWYEFGERRWSDILTGENRRTRRKTYPSATLSTTNPTWIDPGANPGLRGERPATNDLSHGTAHQWHLVHHKSHIGCPRLNPVPNHLLLHGAISENIQSEPDTTCSLKPYSKKLYPAHNLVHSSHVVRILEGL
jgi:hypothetical protein